jgi:hypothetical protein
MIAWCLVDLDWFAGCGGAEVVGVWGEGVSYIYVRALALSGSEVGPIGLREMPWNEPDGPINQRVKPPVGPALDEGLAPCPVQLQ